MYNFVDCFFKVVDDTIGQDEHDRVLLIELSRFGSILSSVSIDVLQDRGELSSTPQSNLSNGPLVGIDNPSDAIALRGKDVAVEREAMGHSLLVLAARKLATKSVDWEPFVIIVIF